MFSALLAGYVLVVAVNPETRNRITFAATVGGLIAILIYRICSVSYHVYADLEAGDTSAIERFKAENAELRGQIADRTNHQALADELTVQHERRKRLIRPPQHLRDDAVAAETEIEQWVNDTLEIMRRHGCNNQEIHHVESIMNPDLVGVFTQFTGKARAVAVRTQRIADIATRHAEIAERLALNARQ